VDHPPCVSDTEIKLTHYLSNTVFSL